MEQDVLSLQDKVNSTLTRGDTTIQKAATVCDVGEMTQKHKNAVDMWNTLKEDLAKKSGQLAEINRLSDIYNGQRDNLSAWISLLDDKLGWQQPIGHDRETVAKQLSDAQSLQSDFTRRTAELEMVKKNGQKLMLLADVDQDKIQQQLDDMESKWLHLSTGKLFSL